MKIGIYDPYLDDLGGGEKYMLKIAECLSSGHDVSVFWDDKKDLDTVLQRFSIDLSRVNISANIFSHNVSFAKRMIESRKYDAIIVLSDGSIPTVLSKKLFLHLQQPLPFSNKSGLKNMIKRARITKIFCNSYYSKSFVDKQLGMESVVVYPPVELYPKKVKKENIILHVGRLRVRDVRTIKNGRNEAIGDYKKQGVMINEFKKLSSKIPGWKFVLAVSVREDEETDFEKLKKEAGKSKIEFLVNKSNKDLWAIYSKAKIYWHASGFGENLERHPEFAEHFGISTVEAMGAGAVPIVINAGGQKEIVEDNVSGFLWNTLHELEEKTILLSSEEKIWETMSREAIKRAKDFAGDRFCAEIMKLIEG